MEFHGILWNSKENIPWNSVWYWDMEFHGIPCKLFHGILWSSPKTQFLEFLAVGNGSVVFVLS